MGWNTTAEWQSGLDNIGMTEFFRDTQAPGSLEEVLSNGNWEVIFHQFCASEFSTENLDFLRAVAVFEASGDLNQAAEIYRQFISESAPQQVNISGGQRAPLDEIFGEGGDGEGPPNLFDEAKAEVYGITRRDTFGRFQKAAATAQQEMGEEIDWDNVEGRERS